MRKLKKAMLVQAILMGTLLLFVGRLMYSFQISSLILILVPIVLLIRRMKRTWSDHSFIKRNREECLWQSHYDDRESTIYLIWSILILCMVMADIQEWISIHQLVFFVFVLDPMLNERNVFVAIQRSGLYIKGKEYTWDMMEEVQMERYRKSAGVTFYICGKEKNLTLKRQDLQKFLDAISPFLQVPVEDVTF